MTNQFGADIKPQLGLLRVAVLRIARGEPLDGLPLPPEVLAEGLAPFDCRVLEPGTALPDE